MKKFNSNRLHQIYSIFLSIIIFLVGILFITSALSIYFTGGLREQIYDVNVVKNRLLLMIFPMILLIFTIIGSSILTIIFPNYKKEKYKFSNYELYKKLSYNTKINVTNDETNLYNKKLKLCKLIKSLLIFVTTIDCSIPGIIGLLYVCNPLHFPSATPNIAIIRMALVLTPLVIYAFICLIIYSILEEVIAKKQVKYFKKLLALKAIQKTETKNKKQIGILVTRIVVLSISIIFITVGVINGDLVDVLKKAINICSECIGLG